MTEIITRERIVTLARGYEHARDAGYAVLQPYADRLSTAVLAWDEQERAALLAGQVAARERAEQAIVRLTAEDVAAARSVGGARESTGRRGSTRVQAIVRLTGDAAARS